MLRKAVPSVCCCEACGTASLERSKTRTLSRTKGLQPLPCFKPSLCTRALRAFASVARQFSSLCFYRVFWKYLKQKTTEVPCNSPVLHYLRALFLVGVEGGRARHRFPHYRLPPKGTAQQQDHSPSSTRVDVVFDLFSKGPSEKQSHPCWERKPGALCRAARGHAGPGDATLNTPAQATHCAQEQAPAASRTH